MASGGSGVPPDQATTGGDAFESAVSVRLASFLHPASLSSSLSLVVSALLKSGSSLADVKVRLAPFVQKLPDSPRGASELDAFISWLGDARQGVKEDAVAEENPRESFRTHAVEVCQGFSNIPRIVRGRFVDESCDVVRVTTTQRDIYHDTTHYAVQTWRIGRDRVPQETEGEGEVSGQPASSASSLSCGSPIGFPLRTKMLLHHSPSGKYAVGLVTSGEKPKQKRTLELWSRTSGSVVKRIVVKHGAFVSRYPFCRRGCPVCWNAEETKFVYLAEAGPQASSKKLDWWEMGAKKKDEKSSDEDEKDNDKDKEEEYSEKYVFEDEAHWGELLTTIRCPKVFVCDCDWESTSGVKMSECVRTLSAVPKELACAQPMFLPSDDSIVLFLGYDSDAPRLGLVYCSQRRNALFAARVPVPDSDSASEDSFWRLSSEDLWNVLWPRVSPDGNTLLFFSTTRVPYHNSCRQLLTAQLTSDVPIPKKPVRLDNVRCVVDIVDGGVREEDGFGGLFPIRVTSDCFSDDGKCVYLTSFRRMQLVIYRIRLEDGAVEASTISDSPDSLLLLSHRRGRLIAVQTSPVLPLTLHVGVASASSEQFSVRWSQLYSSRDVLPSSALRHLEGLTYSAEYFTPKHGPQDVPVGLLLIRPPKARDLPLRGLTILVPHGGPNSTYASYFYYNRTYFVALGAQVVFVNYRGSIGFGNQGLRSLAEEGAGVLDILDLEASRQFVNKKEKPKSIAIFGGSHGGFLALLAAGRYPECYSCVAVRNPVTDLVSFVATSDIPDWAFAVAGFDPVELKNVPTVDFVQRVYERSPIAHVRKVRCPVLLQLGTDDLRVHPSQGQQFHRSLRECGGTSKLKMYPKNSHPLSKPSTQADVLITGAMWVFQHGLPKKAPADGSD